MSTGRTLSLPHRFAPEEGEEIPYGDVVVDGGKGDGDDPRDTPGPGIYGEEIDDTTPCCVRGIAAVAPEVARTHLVPLGNTGVSVIASGRRSIEFDLRMGRPADAAKIRVIQYYRNERQSNPAGPVALVHQEPAGETWTWRPGADGYAVDSADNVRCWPDYSASAKQGLRRDLATGRVRWDDSPGPRIRSYYQLLKTGQWTGIDFPIQYSVEYKTDVLCTDADICKPDNPQVAAAVATASRDDLVARVTWKLRWNLRQFQGVPYVTPADITITVLTEENLNPCGAQEPM